jgi:hypothetical protein
MRHVPADSSLRGIRREHGKRYAKLVSDLRAEVNEWKRRAISARVGEFLGSRALKNIGDKAIRMEIQNTRPGSGELRMLMSIDECVIHGLSQSDFLQILMMQLERVVLQFLPHCRNSPGYIHKTASRLLAYSPLSQAVNMRLEPARYVPPGTDPLPNLPSNVPADLRILGRELHGLLNLLAQRVGRHDYWKECGFPLEFSTREGVMTVTLDTSRPYLG